MTIPAGKYIYKLKKEHEDKKAEPEWKNKEGETESQLLARMRGKGNQPEWYERRNASKGSSNPGIDSTLKDHSDNFQKLEERLKKVEEDYINLTNEVELLKKKNEKPEVKQVQEGETPTATIDDHSKEAKIRAEFAEE